MECQNCISLVRSNNRSVGKIRARLSVKYNAQTRIKSSADIRANNTTYLVSNVGFRGVSNIKPSENVVFGPVQISYDNSNIKAFANCDGVAYGRVSSASRFDNSYTDKISGPISDLAKFLSHTSLQKLYPIEDIETCDEDCFVNENKSGTSLYDSIDPGVLDGSFDNDTYIQPSGLSTTGSYKYKCIVTYPFIRFDESYLSFRAVAPMQTYSSQVPPVHKFSNIRLEDPSGNLIVKYKDIVARGDADYSKPLVNYTTYITEPEINNSTLNTWNEKYPALINFEGSGYTLSMDLDIECLDDPFDAGFNFGYEENSCDLQILNAESSSNDYLALDGSPISTQSEWYHLDPQFKTIRITALEVSNDGPLLTYTSNYLRFTTQVSASGSRITRKIFPSQVLDYNFDAGIYPDVDTRWESTENYFGYIIDNVSGDLVPFLRDRSTGKFITHTDPHDNGKLKLRFSHEAPVAYPDYRGGAFNFGQLDPDTGLDVANIEPVREADTFFTIDSIELKVIAKKETGTDDYVLDVVGYSDDKLLHVTSAVGGFLQNVEGTGNFVATSGFASVDDLGISSEALSDKNQYFEASGSNNAGGDHYKLSTSPVISSTDFEEYTIPLRIYEDNVALGKSIDYSMSSYFENLYVDIYPIPSGASIAHIYLNITYKPSNGLMLHTVGHGVREFENRDVLLLPSSGLHNNIISATYSDGAQISLIENIPHAFATSGGINGEFTLKTNYSRRWRGTGGDKAISAFNTEFDYSFDKDFIQYPFINYYDFTNVTSSSVLPFNISDKVNSNSLFASGAINIVDNLGARFKSDSLFDDATDYQTIDWTSITGYEDDALYGKISDAFDSAIRVSGSDAYLYTYNAGALSDGFAAFIRFSPDIDISGVGYNLFNSGVIFSQFENDLGFALSFEDGYLTAHAKDTSNNIISVQDSASYDEYHYPLSVFITYNENSDNKLRLYTDNDISSEVNLRNTSSAFNIKDPSDNALTVGYSKSSGIGMNMFVSDFGISYFEQDEEIIGTSSGTNISSFFEDSRVPYVSQNSRYKLWQRINTDNDKWHLGAFRICHFNHEFDRFTKRIGSDYIFHHLDHDGSAYSQICDIAMPDSVPSGVAYHTQIENDSLRFGLGAEPGTFRDVLYSPLPRINKNLPRGYNFNEQAFVAETILEYDCYDDIVWEDGNVGPKLIVSLYTKHKEPSTYPTTNYGLINRYTHYLEPSGCWRKISSIFDYDSFINSSAETWSDFSSEKRVSEFGHKYFSDDIDDMFLQYDIVYPSGSAFESTIKVHSVNVRLKDALVEGRDLDNSLNLFASGEKVAYDSLNLSVPYTYDVTSSGLNLFASGVKYEASGAMNLHTSGAVLGVDSMNLHSLTIGRVDNVGGDETLFGSYDPSYGLSLYVSGQLFDDEFMPMYTENKVEDQTTSGTISLVAYNKALTPFSDSLNLLARGTTTLADFYPDSSMNLFTQVDTVPLSAIASTNLYINGLLNVDYEQNSLSLFTINYLPPNKLPGQSETISWDGDNVGTDIQLDDNVYAFLDADDEIRGVNITCYGNCNNDGTCEEAQIITHETIWGDATCLDGGIFRASNVYTNLEASGFKTDVGYSGHFYGIRKYVGLIPLAPYKVLMTGKTGGGGLINVPREMNTIEYGTNDQVAYSGTKLIADDPYSLDGRQEGDQYGKSVSIKGDLMAVGTPYHMVTDSESYDLEKAGTVFVYRRDPEPTGASWDYDKAAWNLETKLSLPSGYLRDYIQEEITIPFKDSQGNTLAEVTERVWKVGQEGREFGHSVHVCDTGDRELITVGGPGSKWSRTFEDLEPSGVSIGLFIFTDEFRPEIQKPGNTFPPAFFTYNDILNTIKDKDLLFKYFSQPFPVKFDVKVLVCDCNADNPSYVELDFPEPKPEGFIYKKLIHRRRGNEPENQNEIIFNDIKSIFDEAFPYDGDKLNSGIPPLLGFFIDNSASLGQKAVQPALDDFIKYYKEYSFASGLQDFYEQPASGATTIYEGSKENWIEESIDVLNHTLDIDRLDEEDQYRFFSESITEFNSELNEFNDPPPSGGAVYIFEKESGVWNLIQTVESPTNSNIIAPDRFGHAVKMSDNGEVLIVGSPYINDAVTVYQYDEREKQRMFNNVGAWVQYHRDTDKTFGYFWSLKDRHDDLVEEYGSQQAAVLFYHELTPDGKYDLRNNAVFWRGRGGGAEVIDYSQGYYQATQTGPIQEYQKIFTYGYGSIPYVGGRFGGFLLEKFAPTSRLGYSVAVNETGDIIAAGAPTDSFNEYDDKDIYWFQKGSPVGIDIEEIKANSTFYDYVNAGAVRLLESRKYFPHNLAIEYGKFGNLGFENREEGTDPYYNHMEAIFGEMGKPFYKSPFAEVDIPEEAGLVFIITPAIDALSDEIMTNIKEWLALGDRHLILVGDDPVYESGGLYSDSTNVINNILDGLSSRMRIYPARNEFEALVSGCSDVANIVPSLKPSKSRNTNVYSGKLFGYGVGDIRLYYPGAYQSYECSLSRDFPEGGDYSFQSANGKCKMPIVHNGDLRAQWYDYCQNRRGDKITFAHNLAMYFGTVTPDDYGCYDGDDDPPPVSVTAGYDPVPILAAAEFPPPITITYPAIPSRTEEYICDREEEIVGSRVIKSFGDPISEDKQFAWSSELTDYNSLSFNIGSALPETPGKFFDPDPYNGKDPVLQAKATSKIEIEEVDVIVYSPCIYAAQEDYSDTSKIYLIAGLDTETSQFLLEGQDRSLYFYLNIIRESYPINKELKIAQLGEWTGQTDFTTAKSNSILESKFLDDLHQVDKDVKSKDLFVESYDVCWIANPKSIPNVTQLNYIKDWLAKGNKKIIITYETTQVVSGYSQESQISEDTYETIHNIKQICEQLNIGMTPLFLTEKNRFALHNVDGTTVQSSLRINQDSFVYSGYPDVENDGIDALNYGGIARGFVPIDLGDNATSIAFFDYGIEDIALQTDTIWQMKAGVAEIKFPVLPGSGYKLFIDLAAEHSSENQPLRIDVSDCSASADGGLSSSQEIAEYNDDDERVVIKSDDIGYNRFGLLANNYNGEISTESFDIKVADGSDEISIYITSQNLDINNLRIDNDGYTPRTPRLISISGCLIEIDEKTVYDKVFTPIFCTREIPGVPERTESFEQPPRQISTDNTKYCPATDGDCAEELGGQLIEDGPIVVAQELEQFSSFEYGENRSRVTVISDSSLIQGPCIVNENEVIHSDVINFIKSLYPQSPSIYEARGRRFNIQYKLTNPEKLSPQKLYTSTGNAGHNLRFYGSGTSQSGLLLSKYIEDIYNPVEIIDRPLKIEEALEYGFLQPLNKEEARTEEDIQNLQNEIIAAFLQVQDAYGGASKFSGILEGKMYADAPYYGGIPEIMKDTGYDYLEFDRFPSGYPGDLFGFSIDLYGDKLVVGSPFAAFASENIISWSGVAANTPRYTTPSGIAAGYNGGAGAVYVFEKTGDGVTPQGNSIPWSCNRKLRPNSINIGQDLTVIDSIDLSESGFYLGDNNYTADDLYNESIITDQFGYSVDIDGDILAVGVPGHDFSNYIEQSGGAFINKAFGGDLNISLRNVYDVGESGFRNELFLGGSGTTAVVNNGAVMVFENRIYDWINKLQRWEFVEKIVQQGHNSRLQKDYVGFPLIAVSGSENDYFGKSVAVDRAKRTDADYSIAIGTPHHKFATSGNHTSDQPLLNAGAIYVYDAMLRERPASKMDENAFIQAKLFGEGQDYIRLGFINGTEPNKSFEATGVIYSNNEGEIFLEVSGQDPVLKGFIQHRPYIESVNGSYIFGAPEDDAIRLYTIGQPPISSGDMNLFTNSEYGNVYTTLGLYEQGIVGSESGSIVLFTECPSGIIISESGVNLYASGIGFNTDTLNLRIRGK